MIKLNNQAPKAVVMVRPHHFYPNSETLVDNSYQTKSTPDLKVTAKRAYDEVSHVSETLKKAGIKVHLFEDEGFDTPDSVFPNNWFTTHSDGHILLYPMFAPSRRLERRDDIIEALKEDYIVSNIVDYSANEKEDTFLEGTGALVLDHIEKIAYMSLSHRADIGLLNKFCEDLGYKPFSFETIGPDLKPIYHTNVMLSVGTKVALVGTHNFKDSDRANELLKDLKKSGRLVIELSPEQISSFAGNALEILTPTGPILVLSEKAYFSLTGPQKNDINSILPLLPIAVPTIEMSGGSIRCMFAGIHLPNKT